MPLRENVEEAAFLDTETTSNAVDLRSSRLKAIRFPSGWTDGTLTFTVSATADGTFVPLKRMAGTTVSFTANHSTFVILDANDLEGLPFVKLVANTGVTDDQTVQLLTEPRT